MVEKLTNMLKEKTLTISSSLFYNYKKLKISDQDFIIIIYLTNLEDRTFNPANIATNLNIELNSVMNSINNLMMQGLLEIETTSTNGIKEVINLDKMYEKLAILLSNDEKILETNIYSIFENELGRTISPSELAVIADWSDQFNQEVIEMALKEAVFNGVKNLRYIDSILKNWESKGIKTKEDVLENQKKFIQSKQTKPEIIDYDWLNEG